MSTQSRVTNFGDQGPSQMRYPGISMSHTAGSGVSAKIRKSSKFLKQQDLLFKRVNPCLDDQPFSILSKSLRTHEVNLRQLLRYATCADYFSMALGLSFSFLSAILYVATIQSFGLFHQFFSEDVAAPCLNIRTTDGTVWQFKYPYLWLCITLTVLSFFENVLLDFSAGRQCKRLQLAYVDALIRKDVTWFDCYIDRDLSFRVRKDMHEIRMGIGEALGELVFQTTASTLMLAASFMLNVKVAFIPLLIAPGFTIVSVLKLNAAKAIHQEDRRAYKPANDVVVQMLQKVLTIKTFGGEGKAVNAYASSLYCVWDLRKLILLAALWSSLCWFISMVSHPFLIWISVDYFDDYTEKMSNIKNCKRCDTSLIWVCPHVPIFGQLYTILMYLVFAVYFLSNTPMVFSRIREAQYRAAEAFFCIDCKTGIDNISKEGHIPRQKAIGEVIISDVTFNYPIRPLKPILVGINIAVHPGQMITIFGPTNCGKTTVLRLLLRKFDICEGSIQLDGTDLHTLNISWLRSQIGYVPQCPVFLNGTIEENLCGPLKPTMEEILRACRKANVISDILALPLGFKTMVGKKSNSKITPLQVKKLFLARIFLKKCRVVLLDDFFCNVDKSNENQLVKLFESIRENMTLIFTSRKISDIMKTCDTVYVMKEGQVLMLSFLVASVLICNFVTGYLSLCF
ncbi:unnamed protein product [Allacma fusca]|uniref:ABC transporter domain-containing protein n=1 Tax=Allacma fusca TaxID=39272 RepID=A0A8J2NKY5_9HEXA|nr:unnamed protein product [Allacma fusca]